MKIEEIEKMFDEILDGIDETESNSKNNYSGWWPTSFGANFGKKKKKELYDFIFEKVIPEVLRSVLIKEEQIKKLKANRTVSKVLIAVNEYINSQAKELYNINL